MKAAPTLLSGDIERLRAAVTGRLGLRLEDDRLPFLEEVLAARLRATGCATAEEYLIRHIPSQAEAGELARRLSVVETYFLRNREQFNALQDLIVERARSGVRHLRVLSAGCSSGEEPYSIALVARENLPELDRWDVSITAIDVNPEGLERARGGRYRNWSLRETPEEVQRRYWKPAGDEFVLDPAVRAMVRFEARNLVDTDPQFWRPEAFDIVFCRNVLMYFTPDAARAVVGRFARSLAPGGYLFLGHAETLRGLSGDFHLCHTHGTFYYRKRHAGEHRGADARVAVAAPAESRTVSAPLDASWFQAIADSSARIHELTKDNENETHAAKNGAPVRPDGALRHAADLWKSERFHDALAALAGPAPTDADSLLLRAMLHLSSGDIASAMRACAGLLEVDDLNAGAHYVMALCHEHGGNRDAAAEHDRAAAYLDADFAMPRLHLGLMARRAGQKESAGRELHAARALLAREDTARIVLFGGGFGREQLVALCDAELAALEGRQ